MEHTYDTVDLAILATIQQNSDGTAGDVAERVGITQNTCWRRLRALQQSGTIMNRVALLQPEFLGCGLTAFVRGRPVEFTPEWAVKFRAAVRAIPNVVEVHRIAGAAEYRLKLRVGDVAGYDTVLRTLTSTADFVVIEGEFSAEEILYTTRVPLPQVTAE